MKALVLAAIAATAAYARGPLHLVYLFCGTNASGKTTVANACAHSN